MASKLPLKQQLEQFKKERTNWASAIGLIAKKHFTDNFNKGGFDGKKWTPRKKDKTTGRAVLVKSGTLKRSITARTQRWDRIIIGSYMPYSQIHNEGGTITKKESSKVLNFRSIEMDYDKKKKSYGQGTRFSKARKAHYSQKVKIAAHKIVIPQRKFIGDSKILDKKILDFVTKKMNGIFKK